MTYLALTFASFVNGVSHLHGVVSRTLLQPVWPGLLESEVPVQSITNGVHLADWTHPEIAEAARRGASARSAARTSRGRRPTSTARALWNVKRAAQARAARSRARVLAERASSTRRDSPWS